MKIKPRILIADSDQSVLVSLQTLLENQGYEIIAFSNGSETLKEVLNGLSDVAILGANLRGTNGFEIVKEIRSNNQTKFLPVIMIIDPSDTSARDKGVEAGCDDFICPPFDPNELSAKAYTLLQIGYCRPLLNEKQNFEHILAHVGDGILVFDNNLKITHISQKAKNLLYIDKNEQSLDFVDHIKNFFKIHHTGDLNTDMKSRSFTFDIVRPATETTKEQIISAKSAVIKNPLGEKSSIALLLNDVTTERQTEALKRDFLSVMSHKLRTPITVLTQGSTMLKEEILGPLSEKQKQTVTAMCGSSQILQEMVERLLQFTNISRQKLDEASEPLNIKNYLTEYINSKQQLLENKKIDFTATYPDEKLRITINSIYCDLLMESLIDNAVKFNKNETVEIKIEVKSQGEKVEISVTDNGIGIPSEEMENIFEKFYQVEKYFTGNVKGPGLGLSLVKQLVTAHGGNIRVVSKLGEGSTFTFTLPVE